MKPRRLKADLHAHAADDPHDTLKYSSEMLIDAAALAGMDVLAITLHESYFHVARLADYAHERGILLIPGLEQMVEGKHVVILNPDGEQARCTTFAGLRALGKRGAALIAPHPFFPGGVCLGKKLIEHIDLFDAIEYCTMYCSGMNFNRKAVRVARQFGKPLVGTSDSHSLPYWGATCTWIESEPTVAGVIDAVRCGRVELETRPRTHVQALKFGAQVAYDVLRDAMAGTS